LNNRTPILARCSVLLAALLSFAFAPPLLRAEQSATGTPANVSFSTVRDETGRTVRIPVPVRRVVSLAPSLTESIYALGMESLLVGDTDYCDYPPAAKKIHKVGGATNPSLEEIAALRPDVVLVTKSLNRVETVQQLERLGIAAYATDPHTVDEIRTSVRRLAEILGNPAGGEALDKQLQHQENELLQRLQNTTPTRVLFVVWTDPLISVGKHTFIADALARAGATSVVDSSQDWPQMSLEEMVHLQPGFLVFASAHSETVSRDVDALAKRPGWDSLEAVKHRRFAVISDAINRPAPRLLTAVGDLARQLHPEAFTGQSDSTKSPAPAEKN
jgi:iron complex transport system substrate-binding protein